MFCFTCNHGLTMIAVCDSGILSTLWCTVIMAYAGMSILLQSVYLKRVERIFVQHMHPGQMKRMCLVQK